MIVDIKITNGQTGKLIFFNSIKHNEINQLDIATNWLKNIFLKYVDLQKLFDTIKK